MTSPMPPEPSPPRGHAHHHSHHGTHAGPTSPAAAWTRRRASVLLAAIVVPLGIITAVGVVLLWPHGHGPEDRRLDATYYAPGGTVVEGTVSALRTFRCPSGDSGPGPNGDGSVTCVRAQVRLDTGPKADEKIQVDLPPEINRAGVSAGDQMRLLHVAVGPEGSKTDYYAFVDFVRGVPMLAIAIAYAVVVIVVARFRGLRALLGLGFAYLILAFFMLPAMLEGTSPLLVGLTGASAIMFVVLYFAHGFSTRTTTALIGTLFGLALTAVLAWWATDAARLTGLGGGDDSFLLLSSTNGLDLSKIVLCGIVIAGLGLLNDVTITQASAVWELHELSPHLPARRLFSGAMRIGRDHIASTVYTIAFAYAGAALPIFLLITLYERPFLTSLTSGELAEEVVRTLVGSIGLVLAIPITTAVGVIVVKSVGGRRHETIIGQQAGSRHSL
ncbi:YibE/F family protein [Actinopolymorpha pittospori]